MANYLTDLYAAAKTALIVASTPITTADQVVYWVDDAIDTLDADSELMRLLGRTTPTCALSYSGSEWNPEVLGGGNEHFEGIQLVARYGVGLGGDDFLKCFTSDGQAGRPWGLFEVHKHVIGKLALKLFNLTATDANWATQLLPRSTETIRFTGKARNIAALKTTFTVGYQHTAS